MARSCDLRMLRPAFSIVNVDRTLCCTRFRLTSQSEVGPSAKIRFADIQTHLKVSRNVRVSVRHGRCSSLHGNFESRLGKGMKRLIKSTAPSLTLTQLAKMVQNAFARRVMKCRQLKEKGRRLTQIRRKLEQEPRGRFSGRTLVCKRVCDYSSLPK